MPNTVNAFGSKPAVITIATAILMMEVVIGGLIYNTYWAHRELNQHATAGILKTSLWLLAGIAGSLLAVGVSLFMLILKWQKQLDVLKRNLENGMSERVREMQQEHADAQELNRRLIDSQQQLLQSDKLSAIGQLAAGVAHEINNPMTFIMGNISCLGQYVAALRQTLEAFHYAMMEQSPGGDKAGDESRKKALDLWASEDIPFLLGDIQKILVESESGGKRIQEIVSHIRLFANLDEAEQKSIDLNQRIDSTLKLASTAFRNRCRIHKKMDTLPPFTCSPGQMSLALLNLLNNAAEAIQSDGDITVESHWVADEIVLAISDNGCGISPENRSKLFTPFFTTKPPGKGVGLGLSLCHGIVKRLHGRIEVVSELGKGTTFTLHLPLNPTSA